MLVTEITLPTRALVRFLPILPGVRAQRFEVVVDPRNAAPGLVKLTGSEVDGWYDVTTISVEAVLKVWASFAEYDASLTPAPSPGTGTGGATAPAVQATSTSLVLDSTLGRIYAPFTVTGATVFTASGSTTGARLAITVVANGTNVPTISGATKLSRSGDFVNVNGTANLLEMRYDGVGARYEWTAAAAVAAVTPGLVTFGDSTVAGTTSSTNRWAVLRAADMGLTLLNQGISGTVMQNRADAGGSPRADNGRGRYVAALLGANRRSHYAILYGLNDLRYTGAPATMNLTNFETDYRAVVQGLINDGVPPANITLGSPIWIPDVGYQTGTSGFTGSTRTVHEQYNAVIYKIAFDFGCKYAASYERIRDNGGATLIAPAPDNIHPTNQGMIEINTAFGAATVPSTGVWPGASAPAPAPAADTTAPVLQSAVATANLVTLTYSEALSATVTGTATLSGGRTVSSATVVGSAVQLVPSTPITNGEVLTVTTPAGFVRDTATTPNLAAALTAQSVTNNVPASGGGADADVDAWLARVGTASGVVSGAEETAVRAFVSSAKASGYFTKFRRLNLFAGDNAASLVPLVGTTADTNVGTTYAANTGRQSNGTSQYINTGHTPTQATGGLSIYLRTTQSSDTTFRIPIGCRNTANTHAFRLTGNSGPSGSAVAGGVAAIWGGTAPGPFASTTGGMTAGMWQSSRTSNTSNSLYKNGALVSNSTTDVTPVDPAVPLFVFAQNGAGTAGAYVAANTQIGAYGVDSGMSDAEAADFYTHMQALMTALGRNV